MLRDDEVQTTLMEPGDEHKRQHEYIIIHDYTEDIKFVLIALHTHCTVQYFQLNKAYFYENVPLTESHVNIFITCDIQNHV